VTLVVALFITSLAFIAAMRGPSGQRGEVTPGNRTATPNVVSSPTTAPDSSTATPTNPAFVCANSGGSTRTYVFLNANHQLYRVTGCSTPVQLTSLDAATTVEAIAFSPTNRRLMVTLGPAQVPETGGPPICQALMDPQTGALTRTTFCEASGTSATYPFTRFIAWLDDNNFLEAQFGHFANGSIPVNILRVSATTLATNVVRTLTWVANTATYDTETGIRLRGGYLYYGGYVSTTEGGAWLHRLALAGGTDTRLVKLGLAGSGGCQVYDGPCNWTGWWDISASGDRIVYHNPGPTVSLSDTTNPTDTPLYIANPDGSAALKLTSPPPSDTTTFLSSPALAPNATWVTAPNSAGDAVLLATDGSGTSIALPAGYSFVGWLPDSTAALLVTQGPNYTQAYAVFTLATRSVTKLGDYTGDYVWGA